MTNSSPRWFKSSYSDNGGQCIEVAANVPGIVPVRDSKAPNGPQLTLTREAFAGLVQFAKANG
ncbi:DUF397 domain-containing protein [Streptomyces sp. WZ-12]|uniref:DUF397 domain-containing protein n=1 Tax=Streptomyces sp. WZ-12 TaxID=3030210 RepID=UPI0023813F64|nr:DUF397 domain-containing protein [Streptomyces sp. WZ-12]